MFFIAELDRKDKITNQNQEDIEVLKKELTESKKEILYLNEKIKENGVKKKVPKECSSSRSPIFHTDEHHIRSCTNKLHAEKSQAVHTDKLQPEKVCTTKKYRIVKTLHTDKSVHTDKFDQAD
ncbi:unnamed protein product [Lactuca saligna]|uniref:Uncharacterized protein n=1 Tax=Lactuca saligna TaxID=75948 RepID=A0AA36ES37_LACSI|nr:unnamed protein product [Lactuca saligna]